MRVWERSPPETGENALNGIGTSARGSERWVERALLTEAKGSVRSVAWTPKSFGLKFVRVSRLEYDYKPTDSRPPFRQIII